MNNNYSEFNKLNISYCRYCGRECKNINSLKQHECRCHSNPNRISTIRIGFNNKGRPSWNKGLTKDTDKRVAKGCETYHKNSILGKHVKLFGDRNPSKRQDVRDKISKTCLNKSKNGEWHTSLAKNMHISYKGFDLHGTWELAYAQYLDSNNILWTRCKDRFEYTYNNSLHYYTPDFYLTESNTYIEIKGYPTGKDYAKWRDFPSDKKLVILKYKDLLSLGISLS